jgi:hypothetical protein
MGWKPMSRDEILAWTENPRDGLGAVFSSDRLARMMHYVAFVAIVRDPA